MQKEPELAVAEMPDQIFFSGILYEKLNLDAHFEYGDTPLIMAIRKGYIDMARELISAGADKNLTNNNDWTPLMMALINRYLKLADELIEGGANVNAKNKHECNALGIAVNEGYLKIVKELIAKPEIAINTRASSRGETPLMLAAKKGYMKIAEELIDKGAILDTQDDNNETAISHARKMRHSQMVEFLLNKEEEFRQKSEAKKESDSFMEREEERNAARLTRETKNQKEARCPPCICM